MDYASNEFMLLTRCAKSFVNPRLGETDKIKTTVDEGIDWQKFLLMASAHSISLLVWHSFNGLRNIFAGKIPATVLASLEENANRIRNKVNLCASELNNVTTALSGVPFLIFKGPSIGRYYADNTLRHWGDLDLIIHKEDFFKVKDLLGAIGFVPKLTQDEMQTRLKADCHSFPFQNARNVELDIHWRIENAYENLKFPMEAIWVKPGRLVCAGVEIPTLSAEYLIFATCIHHGVREAWYRLKYISDFAVLVNNHKDLDWLEMARSAKTIRIKKAFLVGFLLINHFFEIEIPDAIKKEIAKDKSTTKAADLVRKLISNSRELLIGRDDKVSIQYLLMDNSTKVMRLKASLMKFGPSQKDKSFLRLPLFLRFFYVVLRPFRLLFNELLFKRVMKTSFVNFRLRKNKA